VHGPLENEPDRKLAHLPGQQSAARRVAVVWAAPGGPFFALLKADDPIIVKAETRDRAFVAATLQVAQEKLEKAAGL
jgi:hypothetical protein